MLAFTCVYFVYRLIKQRYCRARHQCDLESGKAFPKAEPPVTFASVSNDVWRVVFRAPPASELQKDPALEQERRRERAEVAFVLGRGSNFTFRDTDSVASHGNGDGRRASANSELVNQGVVRAEGSLDKELPTYG